ncbi:MAG: hypothetical protein GY711_10545 [bacterium]|nr:hypothetical protein [bacterium]
MQRICHLAPLVAIAAFTAAPAQAQWSTATLSHPRGDVTSVSVGDLVLFAGGRVGNVFHDTVDIYDAALGLPPSDPAAWSSTTLSVARTGIGGAVLDDLAFFAGGSIPASTAVVDIFDARSRTWSTAALSVPRGQVAATTVGDKVLFAGGQNNGPPSAVVDIFDGALGLPPSDPAAWSTATLSTARTQVAAASVGTLAIFAGGRNATAALGDADIYDSATDSWSVTALSQARIVDREATATTGTRAYFAGGQVTPGAGATMSDVVDIFDAHGGQSSSTLSTARGYVGATALGNTVIFAGGAGDGFVLQDTVDMLNTGTGQWSSSQLSQPASGLAAAAVGRTALFAGALVEVYAPTGVNYCSATANSAGVAATIAATGSTSAAANDLTLTAVDLPPGQFGYFLGGQTEGFLSPLGSQGFICLSGNIGRFSVPSQIIQGPAGSIQVDVSAIPVNPTQAVQPGDTWNFQCWYRDNNPGPTSNFTDAVSVVFE